MRAPPYYPDYHVDKAYDSWARMTLHTIKSLIRKQDDEGTWRDVLIGQKVLIDDLTRYPERKDQYAQALKEFHTLAYRVLITFDPNEKNEKGEYTYDKSALQIDEKERLSLKTPF